MRRILPLALLLTLTACLPGKEDVPEITAEPGTGAFLEQQQAVCEARGGQFGSGPGKSTKVCFLTPADANQPCQRKSDCEGLCLARSMTCAPVTPMFGCNDVLLDSGQRATICLD